MFSYTLIPGGYNILCADGNVLVHQPFNPISGNEYTALEAEEEAKTIVAQYNTVRGLNLISIQQLKIRSEGARRLAAITEPYMPEERDSWPQQVFEVQAYDANPAIITPMLTVMAESRGISRAELVQKIKENALLFSEGAGKILGEQQKLLDQLSLLPETATEAEILAIYWS